MAFLHLGMKRVKYSQRKAATCKMSRSTFCANKIPNSSLHFDAFVPTDNVIKVSMSKFLPSYNFNDTWNFQVLKASSDVWLFPLFFKRINICTLQKFESFAMSPKLAKSQINYLPHWFTWWLSSRHSGNLCPRLRTEYFNGLTVNFTVQIFVINGINIRICFSKTYFQLFFMLFWWIRFSHPELIFRLSSFTYF